MLHALSLGLALFGTWLLLSGYFKALLIGLGVASCLLVVWIAHRMDVVDHEGQPVHLGWRAVTYWLWLLGQIVLANVYVARRILHPKLPIDPVVVRVTATQRSELGQVIYANSITLTPGTVSMRVGEGTILVHALTAELARELEAGAMDRRVSATEGDSGALRGAA